MSESTLMLNGRKYELTDEFKQSIEDRARGEFRENDFLSLEWGENERGDPVLYIQTEGYYVPWDRLEVLQFDYEEVEYEDDSDDSDDDTEMEEVDEGNGMKTIPRDDVDMDPENPGDVPSDPENPGEMEEPPDTKFMVTHPQKHYIPQPEDDDPERVPADPEELPEDPSLVYWLPEEETTECWSVGRALIPTVQNDIEWNVQVYADEAPDGATKLVADDEQGGVKEVPQTNRHDDFEQLCEMHDCEVIAEKKPSDSPPQSFGKEPDEDEKLDGIAGGNNWNFGNN